jgi:molybdopterin adenylyltransferase
MNIGRITISDRACAGIYPDLGGPEIERVLREQFPDAHFEADLVPDEIQAIRDSLQRMTDDLQLELVVTTGGTGIGPRDLTPEATRGILEKELPGFGEAMRMASFGKVRTTILSRATAGIRGHSLILNLPGKPAAIRECISVLAPAIREGLAHLSGDDPHAALGETAVGLPR